MKRRYLLIGLWFFFLGYGAGAFFATNAHAELGGLGSGLGMKSELGSGLNQRWNRVDPYNVNDRKTITRDRKGNYVVTDPYDATYRREIRRTQRGGYVETNPYDATYRREWRR